MLCCFWSNCERESGSVSPFSVQHNILLSLDGFLVSFLQCSAFLLHLSLLFNHQ